MTKRQKIWIWVMIVILILDVVMHFTVYTTSSFGSHTNYIASILMAFTLGLEVADTPRFRG